MKRVLSMEDKWKGRKAPRVTDLEETLNLPKEAEYKGSMLKSQRVLPLREQVEGFLQCCTELAASGNMGKYEFDKDDALAMSFVSYCANLRMHTFHIKLQSEFTNKGIAGNIVHALATTNAIVAGCMITEAVKMLNNQIDFLKIGWISKTGPRILHGQTCDPPNEKCFVCQKNSRIVELDTNAWTLRRFIDDILLKRLGFVNPDLCIEGVQKKNYVEWGDEDMPDDYYTRKISDPSIGITANARVSIDDFSQKMEATLVVTHKEFEEKEVPEGFMISTDTKEDKKGKDMGKDDNDVQLVTKKVDGVHVGSGQKRSRDAQDLPESKKQKMQSG